MSARNVLIVDDEVMFTQAIARCLSELGCEVTVCNDPVGAVAIIAAKDFDLVLLDLKMPRMSGDQVLAEALKTKPDLNVVVCTGHRESPALAEILKHKTVRVVFKPIDTDDLRKIIK